MTQKIFEVLLEQIPVVIVLGLAIYYTLKEKRQITEDCKEQRKEHQKELSKLNQYIRDREKENYDTLNDLIVLLEDVETNQKIILSKIDAL